MNSPRTASHKIKKQEVFIENINFIKKLFWEEEVVLIIITCVSGFIKRKSFSPCIEDYIGKF